MDFLEKQRVLRKIEEINPALLGLLSEEEIEEIHQAIVSGGDLHVLLGKPEKGTLRAAATGELVEEPKKEESEPTPESESEPEVGPEPEKEAVPEPTPKPEATPEPETVSEPEVKEDVVEEAPAAEESAE